MTFFDAVHYLGIAAVGVFGIIVLIAFSLILVHLSAYLINSISERTETKKNEKNNTGITPHDFR